MIVLVDDLAQRSLVVMIPGMFSFRRLLPRASESVRYIRRRWFRDDNLKKVTDAVFMYIGVVPPERTNWRTKGILHPRKQIGEDCFACASIVSSEAVIAIKTRMFLALSVQELLDLSPFRPYSEEFALYYMHKAGGLTSNSKYPYRARGSGYGEGFEPIGSIDGLGLVPTLNVYAMMQAVSQQPIMAAIDSRGLGQHQFDRNYMMEEGFKKKGKIVKVEEDHCVTIVGYDFTAKGKGYWIALNSWGCEWGDKGYFKVVMGKNCRGIESSCCFPIKHSPQALSINIQDMGNVVEKLKRWPQKAIQVILVSDGAKNSNIAVAAQKLSLFTSQAGISPTVCLSAIFGDNNKMSSKNFNELLLEFILSVRKTYGKNVYVQFRDFDDYALADFFAKYKSLNALFNEDIQGISTLFLAGVLASQTYALEEHRFVFVGVGEDVKVMMNLISLEIKSRAGISLGNANMLQIDPKEVECSDKLVSLIKSFRPSILVGLSGRKNAFTKKVVLALLSVCEKPIIFALSAPEPECTAMDVYCWSKGKVMYSSVMHDRPFRWFKQTILPRQACCSYIYPGLALGVILSGAYHVDDELILVAARTLASQVLARDLKRGQLHPNYRELRVISAHIAAAVAAKAYDLGIASMFPRPKNLLKVAQSEMCQFP